MLTESQIQTVVADVLDREGGFTQNPADSGGATNFGITQTTANDYGLGDVRNLTRQQAAEAYVRMFHDWKIDTIPDYNLFALVADSCTNHGVGNGVRWLQQAIGVVADGDFGPVSQSKLKNFGEFRAIYYHVLALRTNFYGTIISKNASQAVFASGWLSRLSSFVYPQPIWN